MKNYIQIFLNEHGIRKNEVFYVTGAMDTDIIGVYRFNEAYALFNVCNGKEDKDMMQNLLIGRYTVQSMNARKAADSRISAVA